jgi:fructose-bisphosphate aldolase, class II
MHVLSCPHMTLLETIRDARAAGRAIGHFNISDLQGFHAVVEAARELNVPVVIGVSEGERDFLGVANARALVDAANASGSYPPVYLNADHSYSLERVREAAENRFDSVIIDAADKPYAENVALAKEAVSLAKSMNPGMVLEAELGFIGQSSKVLDAVPESVSLSPEALTSPEDAAAYVAETGVDLLAPAVGNIHGLVRGGNPKLDIPRIEAIAAATDAPLVLHGGSGISDDDFKAAIKAGIAMVHINTEIRVAYRETLARTLAERPDEVAPYKFMKPAVEAMKEVVLNRLRLFSGL